MIKIILLLSCTLFLFTSIATGVDKSDGCGVGWSVTKKHTLSATSTRATTDAFINSILPGYTSFAMTSGTSNCAKHSIVQNEKLPIHYAEANFDNLILEMSLGKGEYLQAFAKTLGCNDNVIPAFSDMVQSEYSKIFTRHSIGPNEMLNNFIQVINGHRIIKEQCQHSILI